LAGNIDIIILQNYDFYRLIDARWSSMVLSSS